MQVAILAAGWYDKTNVKNIRNKLISINRVINNQIFNYKYKTMLILMNYPKNMLHVRFHRVFQCLF